MKDKTMKTRKQHLQDIVESLEREMLIGEINRLFIDSLDPSQPYGIGQKTKTEAHVQEDINQKKQQKILDITKHLLAKEEEVKKERDESKES